MSFSIDYRYRYDAIAAYATSIAHPAAAVRSYHHVGSLTEAEMLMGMGVPLYVLHPYHKGETVVIYVDDAGQAIRDTIQHCVGAPPDIVVHQMPFRRRRRMIK